MEQFAVGRSWIELYRVDRQIREFRKPFTLACPNHYAWPSNEPPTVLDLAWPRRFADAHPRLQRDRQQWIYDYVVKETGRVFHWDEQGRELPASVKSHAQISKHLGRIGQRMERVAAEEEAVGHTATAFELYFRASAMFAAAQHPVLETNDEKKYLHGRCIANYEKVIQHAPYPLERVEVPFEGVELQCNLHLLPGKPQAPVVIFIPGCDLVSRQVLHPRHLLAALQAVVRLSHRRLIGKGTRWDRRQDDRRRPRRWDQMPGAALFSLSRNLGNSIGVSIVIAYLSQRTQVNHAALADYINPVQSRAARGRRNGHL